MVKIGIYQHFKGNFYKVIHVAKHSESEDFMVVYHPKNEPQDIWVRPLLMFDEIIVRQGKHIKRFKFISEDL
jgi:hypothetical protein